MDEQDKQFFREMLDQFGRNLDEKLDARFEEQAARFDEKLKVGFEEQARRFDRKLEQQSARFDEKLKAGLEEQGARFDEKLDELDRKMGVMSEVLEDKLGIVAEGHRALVERIDRVEVRIDHLEGKMDRFFDGLTAHRLDPEAHRGYRVSEPEGGSEK